ncbi:hypothetical protein RCG24_16895 [Neobacillus sp. OS1-32]|nr:hypothetical protein [Neobacillus sp. OS1-32]WML29580.1 hypothetical protein RCG24_16895 [Neobacillus sp. OS1-32]
MVSPVLLTLIKAIALIRLITNPIGSTKPLKKTQRQVSLYLTNRTFTGS